VIVSLNGKPLNSFAELRSRIATTEPGTKVKLGLCATENRWMSKSRWIRAPPLPPAPSLSPGAAGASLSDGQMKDGTKGVVIDNVDKGSPPRRRPA
jgi:serine protease DegQ